MDNALYDLWTALKRVYAYSGPNKREYLEVAQDHFRTEAKRVYGEGLEYHWTRFGCEINITNDHMVMFKY